MIAAAVLVIAAIAVIVLTAGAAIGPVLAVAVAAAKGIIIGAVVGGLSGGLFSLITGGSFWTGFEEGAFSGAVSGAFTGGLSTALTSGGTAALSLGKTMHIGDLGDSFASVLTDIGDMAIKHENISVAEFTFHTFMSFGLGALSSGVTAKLGDKLPLRIDGVNKGRGSWSAVWKTQLSRSLKHHTRVKFKTIMKGFGAQFLDGVWDYEFEIPKSVISSWAEKIGFFQESP